MALAYGRVSLTCARAAPRPLCPSRAARAPRRPRGTRRAACRGSLSSTCHAMHTIAHVIDHTKGIRRRRRWCEFHGCSGMEGAHHECAPQLKPPLFERFCLREHTRLDLHLQPPRHGHRIHVQKLPLLSVLGLREQTHSFISKQSLCPRMIILTCVQQQQQQRVKRKSFGEYECQHMHAAAGVGVRGAAHTPACAQHSAAGPAGPRPCLCS